VRGMLGAAELDATITVILLLEAGFVTWLVARARRERFGGGSYGRSRGASYGLVDDAVRLGLRARRHRA